MRFRFFSLLTAFLLAGCAATTLSGGPEPVNNDPFPAASVQNYPTPPVAGQTMIPPLGAQVATQPQQGAVRVAILVPQSGPNAALGESLLQAAQLAVFDLNETSFQLIPKDTHGTPEGATQAVQDAARDGAKLILGPLFAQEVEAAKNSARAYGLTVIAFSTDWRMAGDNVYLMGVLPFGQAERIADYASRQGLKRIGIVATNDVYGDAVVNAFQTAAQRSGVSIVKTVRIAANGSDAPQAAQQLSNGQMLSADRMPYDALFMPVGGSTIKILAASLKSYGMSSGAIRYLGTGLWDDAAVLSDSNMSGAIYAAPSPQLRTSFEKNYQRIYGSVPPRLASIGYDSAALAIVLARNAYAAGQNVTYDRAALTNPNGFSGVDGIFRFAQNGLAERGMAVLQIGGGSARVLEPAPSTFQGN